MTFTITHSKGSWRHKWFDFQFIKPGVMSHANPLSSDKIWSVGVCIFGHSFSLIHWGN